ncbi:MAG: ATP synthase F1 subunit delta [bacterium]|nr:ATP synthase F1 subunit delta [bacterium]
MLSKAARRYSIALYEVAESQGNIEQVSKDISDILGLINSNTNFALFLSSPVINRIKKTEIVKEIFGGKVSELTMSFMVLLLSRGREKLTRDVFFDFLNLKKEKNGIVDVSIRSAVELNDEEKARMKEKIDGYTHLKSDMTFEIDKSIIGGFIAKINDTVLDASIKRQLERLKIKFREGDFILN